jgi:hypothetical protein
MVIESIWDGDSRNRNSDSGTRAAPDWRDWQEIIRQMATTQNQVIGLNGLLFSYDSLNNLSVFTGIGVDPILLFSDPLVTRFGGLSDYTEFEVDGTIKFVGDATTWDDIRVPLSATRVGAAQIPDFSQVADNGSGSVGVYAFIFPDSTLKQVFFALQLPHSYKLGSDLHPHIHWMPQTTNTGTVNWEIEYSIISINGTLPNTTLVALPDDGAGVVNTHQLAENADISGTGLGLSSMLLGRLSRNGGAGADDFVGDAALLEFDLHFEQDTVGSREELIK